VGAVAPATMAYWEPWLADPGPDLFSRGASAIGFFALVAHEGLDPFGQIQALSASSSGAALSVLTGARPGLESAWGPVLAPRPDLGRLWDPGGPGIPRREPPSRTISNGQVFGLSAQPRGAGIMKVNLVADIVTIAAVPGGNRGFFRTPGGVEQPLTSRS